MFTYRCEYAIERHYNIVSSGFYIYNSIYRYIVYILFSQFYLFTCTIYLYRYIYLSVVSRIF